MMDILGYLFVGICMIPIFRMRKKISFFFCPHEIVNDNKKSVYFMIYCFLPSFIITGIIISNVREWIVHIESIKEYENMVLIPGLGLLLILLAITARMAEAIVYFTNSRYSEWKDMEKERLKSDS